tara:strand:+ start:2514 stop:3368 length:855 start_codon:yes stop_codon:yes gene_type:complete
MGRLSKLKREAINEANRRNLGLLTESRAGRIENGDTDTCLIKCNIRHAKYGSNGEIVKKIQHLLGNNGFNEGAQGGGIKKGCIEEWPVCDGKFRRETKKAVEEFQRAHKLSIDGIVGPKTLDKMCEVLKFTISLSKDDFCPFQCKCDDIDDENPGKDVPIDGPGVPITGDEDIPKLGEIDVDIRDEQCGDIFMCIKKINTSSQTIGDRWKAFMECIKRIKGLPPIKDDYGCDGCPKYVWGGNQVAGGDKAYWERRDFLQRCLEKGCSTYTRDEDLMRKSPELFN